MQNRLADAESALQKSLEKDPALSASQSLLREVQDKLKSPGLPGNGDWVNKLKQADKLGQVSGQQKEALKLYRAVIRQGHFSAPVWRNVGVLHAQLNQWAEAGPAFEEAEKLDPKNPELVKMRVLSLEKLGKREESIAVLKAGAERTGDAELKRIVEQVR
jgi:tetratricopeptide (TPR) repeat protein